MHRCYHPQADWSQPSQRIEGEEAQHALKVMRLREGDTCQLFDGKGTRCNARISHTEGNRAMELQLIGQACTSEAQANASITLALAIPKGSNMDLIVQKAVELGVDRIIPLITQRTIVRLKAKEQQAKREKWQRTILEACKQSGVDKLPEIDEAQALEDLLSAPYLGNKLCCAILEHAKPMRQVMEQARQREEKNTLILIGPEGDFSPEEYCKIEEKGYAMVSLGSIILRVETAVFMAIAQVSYAIKG